MRGATEPLPLSTTSISISIHAPLAGCDGCVEYDGGSRLISIHAPLAGCDPGKASAERQPDHFNPRTPCGVRLVRASGYRASAVFQSTHPLRGATAKCSCWEYRACISIHAPLAGCDDTAASDAFDLFTISIHAPLAGCDVQSYGIGSRNVAFQSTHPLRGATLLPTFSRSAMTFQSTHPLRGATYIDRSGNLYTVISIHAPLAGCDEAGAEVPANAKISIHAPLAGCDDREAAERTGRDHFNPRTPCGVRHQHPQSRGAARSFQSTHPLRGATRSTSCYSRLKKFQSTHPLRGATALTAQRSRSSPISIHAPLAGCDKEAAEADMKEAISIHAPLAGCDASCRFSRAGRSYFNPRTPCGVRQYEMGPGTINVLISIHAPLAGCDQAHRHRRKRLLDFNPRTPCGVRHINVFIYYIILHISIHAPLAGCDEKI